MNTDAARVAQQIAEQVAVKVAAQIASVDNLVRGYMDDVTRDYMDVMDGTLLSSEARRRHRTYIKDNAEAAYLAGLTEGGAPDAEMTTEDNLAIAQWIGEQLGYVGGLWTDIDKLVKDYADGMLDRAGYEAGRRSIYERIGLWGDALRQLAGQGKASALGNKMVTWRYGDTQHCSTCQKLHGKRHRLTWFTSRGYIPQERGSQELECGGWRCQCVLVDDAGKQVLP